MHYMQRFCNCSIHIFDRVFDMIKDVEDYLNSQDPDEGNAFNDIYRDFIATIKNN